MQFNSLENGENVCILCVCFEYWANSRFLFPAIRNSLFVCYASVLIFRGASIGYRHRREKRCISFQLRLYPNVCPLFVFSLLRFAHPRFSFAYRFNVVTAVLPSFLVSPPSLSSFIYNSIREALNAPSPSNTSSIQFIPFVCHSLNFPPCVRVSCTLFD